MQALITTNNPLRLVATKLLSYFSPKAFVGWQSPMQLRDIADPALPAPDWLVAKTRLCGLCGSDYKQVFMNGRIDNPMTSMISWPQVLGHEVVGVVTRIGDKVSSRRVGERVLLNPWLSCVTRGLPPCEFCQQGKLAQCLNFGAGHIERGIHHGNSASATGGFAEQVPGHESQWFPIPDAISDEAAVLGDPFSVSFHAILKAPPREHGTVLVYGCGTLGLLAIAILRAIHPDGKDSGGGALRPPGEPRQTVGRARRVAASSDQTTGARASPPKPARPSMNPGPGCPCSTAASMWSTIRSPPPRPWKWDCA